MLGGLNEMMCITHVQHRPALRKRSVSADTLPVLANGDLGVSAPVGSGDRVPPVLRREFGGIGVQGEEVAVFPLPAVAHRPRLVLQRAGRRGCPIRVGGPGGSVGAMRADSCQGRVGTRWAAAPWGQPPSPLLPW